MKKRVITTLAIGEKYLDMAYACMCSARKFFGDSCEYAIFFGEIRDKKRLSLIRHVNLFNIEDMMYQRRTKKELAESPFLYREFKYIPFFHDAYSSYDLIFLDADSIVFEDKFETLFKQIEEKSVVIFGSFKDDSYYPINFPNLKINLKEVAEGVGYKNIKNMGLNSGYVGRSGDSIGKRFGEVLYEIINKGEIPFPKGYYNDELYFMLAFQLAIKGHADKGGFVPNGWICTTHGADIITRTGRHNVFKKLSGEGLIDNPAIVHYVEKVGSREYRRVFKKSLPSKYRFHMSLPNLFKKLRL